MKQETIKSGFKYGSTWGLVMFFIMEITPLLDGEKFQPLEVTIGFIIWMVVGWVFGVWMNHILKKVKQKKMAEPEP